MWKNQNTYAFPIEMLNGTNTWKQTGKFLEFLNIELSYDAEIPPLGVKPRNTFTQQYIQ